MLGLSRRHVTSRRKHRNQIWNSRARLGIERLETRTLLSTSALSNIMATPALTFSPNAVHNSTPTGYSPQQIREAYGFDDITFNNGTIVGDGSGQTIAIVVAYSNPNAEKDLQVFSDTFGLPDANFKRVSQKKNGQLPATDPGWALETALDVQWAHAIAPKANILLVEANSASFDDMFAAVNYARQQPGVSVVSMSWGANEFYGQQAYDNYFTTPSGHTGVTFVAASGDSGGLTNYPSVSPNVVSVGGTSLRLNADGSRAWEPAWYGSDGGVSRYESKPSYQSGVNGGFFRATPDVSYNASMLYGVSVYSSVPVDGQTGWFELGGTSAGAPQWAGLFAIVNQGRALAGLTPLDGRSQTLPGLYNLPSSAFLDVTRGVSGLYNHAARTGYDLITGRGSPYSQLVVQGLVGASSTGGVFVTLGPSQSTTNNPTFPSGNSNTPGSSGSSTNGTARPAVVRTILFINFSTGDTDAVLEQNQRVTRTTSSPIPMAEIPGRPATPRFYSQTRGYKTAGGEEAPYWMDDVDTGTGAPTQNVQPDNILPLPPLPLPRPPERMPPVIEIQMFSDVVIIPAANSQEFNGVETTGGSPAAMAALTIVLGGFAGAHVVRSERGRSNCWWKRLRLR